MRSESSRASGPNQVRYPAVPGSVARRTRFGASCTRFIPRGGMVAAMGQLWDALSFGLGMTWEVLWALILGFGLSAAVQAVVSKRELRRLMPDDSPRTLAVSAGL